MNLVTAVVSIVSGGLSGGCVSVFFNRLFHWRELRTRFYPKVSDLYSAYVIRMEKPAARYLVRTIGNNPSSEDEEFVDHRSRFISDLVQFNELKEARVLRKRFLENMMSATGPVGTISKLDLAAESEALSVCHAKLYKKLKF
jgi:hypothetical protein